MELIQAPRFTKYIFSKNSYDTMSNASVRHGIGFMEVCCKVIFFIILLIVFLIIGICEQVYFYRKILSAFRFFCGNLSNRIIYFLTVGLFILTFLPAYFAFVYWFIIELHIAFFLLLGDLAAAIAKKVGEKNSICYPKWLKIVYKTGAAAFLLTFIIACYGKFNMYRIVRTDYDISINKPLSHEYTVALVADLHYGISLDSQQLQAVADSIEEASPDFVILCGDIVDESTTPDGINEAFSILGGIDSKLGVYYVYGNHDKSRYRSSDNSTDKLLINAINDNRINLLEDHAVLLNDEMIFAGRKDKMERTEGGMSINQILADADKTKVIVVADHQPNDYEALRNAGCDLVVSGHTHGGQIFPFGFFGELFNANDMTYGYKKQGNLNEIVTSGIAGWGFDMRTERHSEYVIIHIKGKGE